MGQYHHHQNPSAFDLDLNVVSSICNLYDAEGLYAIDPSAHSPLIGYAYDGYPIYGAYGYANQDGSGGIVRIKSSYQLQNLSSRTNGPAINTTYFLGYFREDYEYVSQSGEDFLDEHNGRVCVTPEYPNGTYAYFCTVDENHNSYYPYAVGPTFYGVYSNASVNSINEGTTIYSPSVGIDESIEQLHFDVFPNPGMDLLAIQANGLVKSPLEVKLLTSSGLLVFETSIFPGQTIAYFDLQTLTKGIYIVDINTGKSHKTFRVVHN